MRSAEHDSALRQAAEVIQRMKLKIRALEARVRDAELPFEPIAIIGAACRLPGADSPDALWRLLESGADPISSVGTPDGPIACGAIDALADFDADFFRISDDQARRMDLRQRLVLEVGWEALEQAAIPPVSLEGSEVGVFIGALGDGPLLVPDDPSPLDISGTLASFTASRLSHVLGVRGPAVVIDTACSSSLVAVHQACRSLWAHECGLALAGGVYVLDRAGRLGRAAIGEFSPPAPHVRCRSFDASPTGLVGSDGCVILALKRLADALDHGDAIWGLVPGSAVNHGRGQSLTAPSAVAQAEVVRKALSAARLDPDAVDYIECHGTGSKVGDSIEAHALGDVFGRPDRRSRPVALGALKSNLGYMGSASGVAGVLKVLLALRYERIPKNLHFEHPNPHVPWGKLAIAPASEPIDWPRSSRPRVAGVSAYGISGINAHVVIQEPPGASVTAARPAALRRERLFLLSAKVPQALNQAAARLGAHLGCHTDIDLGDLEYTLAVRRTHHRHRLAIRACNLEQLAHALACIAEGRTPDGALRGVAGADVPELVWLVPSSSPTLAAARELSAEYAAFSTALTQVTNAIAGTQAVAWMDAIDALETLGQAHPNLPGFALRMTFAELWRDFGCPPRVLSAEGHASEVTVAALAGTLSVADAVARLQARDATPAQGCERSTSLAARAAAVHSEATLSDGAHRHASARALRVMLVPPQAQRETARAALLATSGQLFVAGVDLRWNRVFPQRRTPLPLPTYAWQRPRSELVAEVP